MDIQEMLRASELRTDILTIVNYLTTDDSYSKEEATAELLELLDKHNL
ncbi:hypothetical protein [Peribacillus loiseleuriae]|nr:hypothetical protein [Peribacillus loiseleuriae]